MLVPSWLWGLSRARIPRWLKIYEAECRAHTVHLSTSILSDLSSTFQHISARKPSNTEPAIFNLNVLIVNP